MSRLAITLIRARVLSGDSPAEFDGLRADHDRLEKGQQDAPPALWAQRVERPDDPVAPRPQARRTGLLGPLAGGADRGLLQAHDQVGLLGPEVGKAVPQRGHLEGLVEVGVEQPPLLPGDLGQLPAEDVDGRPHLHLPDLHPDSVCGKLGLQDVRSPKDAGYSLPDQSLQRRRRQPRSRAGPHRHPIAAVTAVVQMPFPLEPDEAAAAATA
jgi:hypothetical protein